MTSKKPKDQPIKVTEREAEDFNHVRHLQISITTMADAMVEAGAKVNKRRESLWDEIMNKYALDKDRVYVFDYDSQSIKAAPKRN